MVRRGEALRIATLEAQLVDLTRRLAGTEKVLALACQAIVELERTKQPRPRQQPSFTVHTPQGVDIWKVS